MAGYNNCKRGTKSNKVIIMFNWERKELIFKCDPSKFEWSKTHTMLPTPVILNTDTIRVFYTTRDSNQQSRISFIDIDKHSQTIKYIHQSPILPLGDLGTFDDRGHTSSQLLKVDNKYLFYINGYNTANTARYRVGIGYAESDDLINFKKPFDGPIIDRSIFSPCGAATPFVIREAGIYRMWYTSFLKWELINGIPEPYYCLKYAESEDLFNWKFEMRPAIDLIENEGGIVRPSVVKFDHKYHMFFSVRKNTNYRVGNKNSYRIGYAVSKDGIAWERERTNINIPDFGWDSEMMAYPYVLVVDDHLQMFYNGNGFGQSGFGLLVSKIK